MYICIMDKIQDKIFGGLTPDQSVGLMVLILLVMCIGMASYITYAIVTNERNFKKFRGSLKVGDITDKGTITKIDGDNVTIETTLKIKNVYPKSQGQIYKYEKN